MKDLELPSRQVADPDLSPEWREALEAGVSDGPTAEQARRLQSAVQLALATSLTVSATAVSTAAAAEVGTASAAVKSGTTGALGLSGAWLKVAALSLTLGAASAGVFLAGSLEQVAPREAPAPSHSRVRSTHRPLTPTSTEDPRWVEEDTPAGDEARSPLEARRRREVRPAEVRPRPQPNTGGSNEVELLDRAHRLLGRDAAQALAALVTHERRYPSSTFEQEREVLAIEALLELGRFSEAAGRAERFLEAHPGSPHAFRVRRAIGREDE